MKVKIDITLKLLLEKSHDGYTAYFPELDLYGMGSTKKKAKKSLTKALNIVIDYCIANETLFDVMEKAGFSKTIRIPKATKEKEYSKFDYTIPLGDDYGKEKQRQYT